MKTAAGLHHIEIYVSDLVVSKQFWSWFLGLLGYQEFQVWDRGFSFIHETTYIVFVQTAEKYMDIEYHRCRTGLNHLAFWASSSDHFNETVDSLRKKGITLLYEDRHPYAGGADYRAAFFEDPDRIKVELVDPS